MASTPFKVNQIESYMPSMEARNSGTVFALDGRNFAFGPLGPGSLFGSRRLGALPFEVPHNVQGIRVKDHSFVFTGDAILSWRTQVPFMWELLYQFQGVIPNNEWLPWSAIFYANKFIFAHPYRGTFTADNMIDTEHLWIQQETDSTIPGLPSSIRGATVARNRAILVTESTIYWSRTDSFADLTPALGGAGFQLITSFVQGTFLAVTGFGDGFIIWTTGGAILAEFIGGDDVWRWTVVDSLEKPIGPWTTTDISNGATVFLSRHGLVINPNNTLPEGWTKEFNEYLLTYMKDSASLKSYWRIDYDVNKQTIFLSESADRQTYFRTLVLSPTRNKWGIFNERHYGLLPLTTELFGYVDQHGYVNYFEPSLYSRETNPESSAGLNIYYPRHDKQNMIVSSSAVSNAYDPDETVPMVPFRPLSPNWYATGVDFPSSPALMGMDSWIEIGYFQPDQMQGSADGQVEIQETFLGSVPSRAPVEAGFAVQWDLARFYPEEEDWSSDPVATPMDILEDWNALPEEVIDLSAFPDTEPTEDWDSLVAYDYDFDDDGDEDWDSESGEEDWNGLGINLPTLEYRLAFQSSQDGITLVNFEPTMARFNHASQFYTGLTSGNLHRLRLDASTLGEFYQIRSLSLTLNYTGELG